MTADCIKSLEKQDYPNFHIILVDNGSTDGSSEILREAYPQVTLLAIENNIGYSLGNNVGIEHAIKQSSDYVFLLNNDTEVDPHMLSQLIEAAETSPEYGLIGPTMYYFDPPDMIWGGENYVDWHHAMMIRRQIGARHNHEDFLKRQPLKIDYIDSCAVLIKRKVLEKIGGMDGIYFINFDDVDLSFRAREAGYYILYVPAARMWHKVSATMGMASPATTYYMTRNSLFFFWRHAPSIWKFLDPLKIILRTIRTVGAWTLKPNYRGVEIIRRKRNANLFALRDFILRRYGKMGRDVARSCYST